MQAPHEVCTEYARTLIRVKARQLIRRAGFSRSDEDDIEQDLLLHLLSQAQHFDPVRASLNTFIARVVDSAVAMMLRDRGRLKRSPAIGVEVQSLAVMVEVRGEPPKPLWATISSADLERRTGGTSKPDLTSYEDANAFATATEWLSPDLRDICRRIMDGPRSGISRRKVRAAMKVIRRHFERAGFGEK